MIILLKEVTRENFSAVGAQAMAAVLEGVRQIDGVGRITICYLASNIRARNFYARVGFEEIGIDDTSNEMIAGIRLQNPGNS